MTIMAPRKKLIEVSIPLEAINAAAAREKSIRHGHPSTLHLWWARRPLAACRAVLFAQLVDDPSSWPDRFPTEDARDIERRRLHRIIEDMVPWEASNNETILNAARWEIARSVAWGLGEEPPARSNGKAILDYLQTNAPPVYDPFSGGGSIPLEAQRLGLRAYGSDLNPVAVLIGKALVEIPPKFAGLPPVNPTSLTEIARGGKWNGKGAQGLAEDVRNYGRWIRSEAEQRIGHLFPKAILSDGSEASVIAWIWARTVRSPDPSARGALVPLASSFMLSTKEGKKVWVEPIIDADAKDGWRFQVSSGALEKAREDKLRKGTKGEGRGSAFSCVLTGAVIPGDYIKAEGMAGRMSARLMAVVAEGTRSRIYISPSPQQEHALDNLDADPRVVEAREGPLSQPVPAKLTGGTCYGYGLTTFDKLFTSRQLIALTSLSDLVGEARAKALVDARASGLADGAPLHEGGNGAIAYADAIATYLGFACSRATNYSASLCVWSSHPKDQLAKQVFLRQALPMTWDFAETNQFSSSGGSFENNIDWLFKSISFLGNIGFGQISNKDAAKNDFPGRVVISSDPPYYDNVGYADLSDFFYVWLKRSLAGVWPDLFRRLITPKAEELVASSYRHGGRDEAEAFFMKGMGEALTAMRKAASDDQPLAIYYAFKQSEAGEDGVTSAGWASFIQAIFDAGLGIDGTWPIRMELTTNLKSTVNALSSAVVIVCRKRNSSAEVVTRAEFVRALKREMPEAIDDIRKAGVGPVDMQQSVIGPGMGVFSRYSKVLEDDDSAMPVKTALSLINRVWEEIDQELDAAFDAETQVALAWFATYGFDARQSGELITLANAKNIGTNALFGSGVFKDLKGKTALTPRDELPRDWTPATDKSLTVWECVQHTARVLNAEDGGGAAAARLVAQMGLKAAEARGLAYRLFEIATKNGWAAEALIYNELAQEWPRLEDLASSVQYRAATVTAQAELF